MTPEQFVTLKRIATLVCEARNELEELDTDLAQDEETFNPDLENLANALNTVESDLDDLVEIESKDQAATLGTSTEGQSNG